MKLQKGEVIYLAKHLKPWLMNSTEQQSVHKWETSQKKAMLMLVLTIV